MSIDIIKIKNTDKKENLSKLKPESLDIGELALVRESNYERLYTKNTDGEVTPLNRIMDAGEIPPPTIQEAWIDTGLAQWSGDTAAMNQVRFNTGLTGNFTPPLVSDVNRLTSMNRMFSDCNGLTSLDLNNFDTSNVINMSFMFYYCTGLTSLDVTSFDTSNVINMTWMFSACSRLTSLDLNSFDTSNVESMSYMFDSCSGLTSLNLNNFNTSKVIDMSYMFYYCTGLTSLDLSNFDTSNVTKIYNMFYACDKLTSLDVSSFNTSNVTSMGGMFYNCKSLTKITCKQKFKDWCWKNQDTIGLPDAMREGGSGTWVIVP